MEKTTRVITSCITFSCSKVNGPPFSLKPILFAGTWKQYSKKAIAQLMRIIPKSPTCANLGDSLNFKCPYQAKVIKALDKIRSAIAYIPFILRQLADKNTDFRFDVFGIK